MLEAIPAVTPDTRSNGSVTADTALRLRRLDITPGVVMGSLSRLQHQSNAHCCSRAEVFSLLLLLACMHLASLCTAYEALCIE